MTYRGPTDEEKYQLETLIDSLTNGIPEVLDMLSVIASSKGDHIRSNWQDETEAKRWEEASLHLDRLSSDMKLKGLGS